MKSLGPNMNMSLSGRQKEESVWASHDDDLSSQAANPGSLAFH